MLRSQAFVRNNWKLSARKFSQLAESFQRDGFIQQYEVLGRSSGDMNNVQRVIFQVMPESEMREVRRKFDDLEASREDKKFISQEINLHFRHRWVRRGRRGEVLTELEVYL